MEYAHQFPVEKMCKVFKVSKSGYYKWRKLLITRKTTESKLENSIRYEFEKSKHTYGSPRVTLALNKEKIICSKATVARYMNRMGIQARRKRKYKVTTQSDHDYKVAPNLLNRQFNVEKLATAWVSDITYVRVNSHWLYLTVIIDLADRMVIGWSLSTSMDVNNTVIKAFLMACDFRTPNHDFIFHSDRGVQYACTDFKTILSNWHANQSMSRKGNCWDNAVAESFFKTLKVECIYKHKISSNSMAYSLIFNYINGWYNTLRIHSHLDGKSPLEAYLEKTNYLYAA